MHLISVNVAQPREVSWGDRTVVTGIFKAPVAGPVQVGTERLAGDGQADLRAHGGQAKAVYAYAAEHYEHWRDALPDTDLPWGAFGENLTTHGVAWEALQIGDVVRAGSALLAVTQPRVPCFKLGIRLGRPDVVRRFSESGRSGSYLSVLRTGTVRAGDDVVVERRQDHGVTVADISALYTHDRHHWPLMRRAADLDQLPQSWRDFFHTRLSGEDPTP